MEETRYTQEVEKYQDGSLVRVTLDRGLGSFNRICIVDKTTTPAGLLVYDFNLRGGGSRLEIEGIQSISKTVTVSP